MRWLLLCLACVLVTQIYGFKSKIHGTSSSSHGSLVLNKGQHLSRRARSLDMSVPAFFHNSLFLSGIDVSGLKVVPVPEDMLDLVQTTSQASSSSIGTGDLASDIQNFLILMGGIAYFVYEKRPRGNARDDLLDIRTSDIPQLRIQTPEPGLGKSSLVNFFTFYFRCYSLTTVILVLAIVLTQSLLPPLSNHLLKIDIR